MHIQEDGRRRHPHERRHCHQQEPAHAWHSDQQAGGGRGGELGHSCVGWGLKAPAARQGDTVPHAMCKDRRLPFLSM
eukprot:363324-Chlamydomonas_euryale.AAC.13